VSAKVIPLPRPIPERMQLSDEALIAGCATGDPAALAVLYRRHHASLHRFLCRLVRGRSGEIEDLVQLAFIGAWQSAHRFRKEASVRTWLFSIAANVAYKHHRSERRRQSAFSWLMHRPSDSPAQPEELVARGELIDRLAEALAELPHDLRVAYLMCEIEEIPGVEAARALGVRPGTVWRRLHHARRQLRDSIQEREEP